MCCMTTREQIISAAKECGMAGMITDVVTTLEELERFATHFFEAGAASRDAEIAQLNKEAADKFSALAKEYDQLRAELEYDQRNAAMSQSESARLLDENTKLRAELAAALAACKAKDEAILQGNFSLALSFQPDDSALKAWLGNPVAYQCQYSYDINGDKQGNWPVEMHTHVSFSRSKPTSVASTPLYSPKGLK